MKTDTSNDFATAGSEPIGYETRWQIMLPTDPAHEADKPAPNFPMFSDAVEADQAIARAKTQGELPNGAWLRGFNVPIYGDRQA